MCAETIKTSAKVCPFCRARQNRFALLKGELPGALASLGIFLFAVWMISWIFADDPFQASFRDFVWHRSDLEVVRTLMEPVGKTEDVWMTGYVTNRGSRPWRVHELEVRFLDEQGRMLDVESASLDNNEVFVVQPHHEHAFRTRLNKPATGQITQTAHVLVQKASDGREYFDPD